MKDIKNMLIDLDGEITRTKLFLNSNGYHHGTSVWAVVNRYHLELKQLRSIIADDLHADGIQNYGDVEEAFESTRSAELAKQMDSDLEYFRAKMAKAKDDINKARVAQQLDMVEQAAGMVGAR